MRQLHRALLPLALLTAWAMYASLPRVARAQTKFWTCDYINVDVTVHSNGDLGVVETKRYVFGTHAACFDDREIPLSHLTSIDDVRVEWVGIPADPRQLLVERRDENLYVRWGFPATRGPTAILYLRYTVHGATRIYETGDEVWWKAIGGYRSTTVDSSLVTVHLPGSVDPDDIFAAAYGVAAKTSIPDARTIAFRAGPIDIRHDLDIRVRFPHGLVHASPPPWQAEYDRQVAYDRDLRPRVTLLTLLVSVAFLLAGNLSIVLWRHRRRRNAAVLPAPIVTQPPSDLAPALAGILVRQTATVRDVVATLVDLARRGVIEIEETGTVVRVGLWESRNFLFRLLQPAAELRPYEATILSWFFLGNNGERRLSELLRKFRSALPDILRLMRREAVAAGLFPRDPETGYWSNSQGGLLLAVLGVVGAIVCAILFSTYTLAACAPGLALAAAGVSLAVQSGSAPQWTPQGARQAAQWQAFRHYLKKIEMYTPLAAARGLFELYLPYAIAFGLDRDWICKFANVDAPVPGWYRPCGSAPARRALRIGPRPGRAVAPWPASVDIPTTSLWAATDGLLDLVESAVAFLGDMPPDRMR